MHRAYKTIRQEMHQLSTAHNNLQINMNEMKEYMQKKDEEYEMMQQRVTQLENLVEKISKADQTGSSQLVHMVQDFKVRTEQHFQQLINEVRDARTTIE
jgi:hypothetical protein